MRVWDISSPRVPKWHRGTGGVAAAFSSQVRLSLNTAFNGIYLHHSIRSIVCSVGTAMLPSGSTSSPFAFAFPETDNPFLPPLEPVRLVAQDSNCTSIAWATFSACYSYPLLLALHDVQQPALEAYAGAFQTQSENIEDLFDSSLYFGSNEYGYGSSGFPASQYTHPGHVDLGGPSCARHSARLVLYIKTKIIN
jgi:hypothetical protein